MAERTALNLVGHLSGISTATAEVVRAVSGTGAWVCCTRKTLPGLRTLQKYVVQVGGGRNHRLALDGAILIKDNHVALAGGVEVAVRRARARAGHLVQVEVEVDSLEQLGQVPLDCVDAVLLDNFSLGDLAEGVARVGRRVVTEASGGITVASAADVARTGVAVISLGWLTHTVRNLDSGLDMT